MRTESDQVQAPPFPRHVEWLGTEPLVVEECVARGPLLVEFWDFARVNSLRTLPYMETWHERYAPLGATILGVHAPGFSCSAGIDDLRAAVARLGVARPVMHDAKFDYWYDYDNKGWPARYLWGPQGHIRYWHYGEGDYQQCGAALQDALREFGYEGDLPPVVAPVRPEDEPDARMAPQTADLVLPQDRSRVELVGAWDEGADWLAAVDAAASLSVACDAGEAWAVLSGPGVDFPGCRRLEIEDGRVTVVADRPGLKVHALQFTPVPPG